MGQRFDGEKSSRAPRTWIPPVTTDHLYEEDVHVLLWQVQGSADLVIEGEQHGLVSDQAMWVPVRTHHRFTVHADAVLTPLFFDAAQTATTLLEPHHVTVDRELQTLMLAYMATLYTVVQQRPNLARQILAIIEEAPAVSISLPMPTKGPAARIAQALRFNPGDNRTVEELAALAHTSTRTVERSFRAEAGMTLRQWRIRNRMEAAVELLRSGSTVGAVSQRVGYTNVNSFRHVFTQHFGLSPTDFAAQYVSE